MEDAIRLFACLQFLIIGLSHLVQPRPWVEWFAALHARGTIGVFANGLLSLLFGSIIVSFHNVWTGLPVILTVVGWIQILKAAVAFTLPSVALRGFERAQRPALFRLAGAISLAFGGLLLHLLLRGA